MMSKQIYKKIKYLLITICILSVFNKYSNCVTEVKFEESIVNITPRYWVSLPNGVVEIIVKGKGTSTDTFFKMKYDFFDNNISTKFDFNLWFKSSFFGIELSDRIDFEEFISNQNYIQRSRWFMPHYDYLLAKNIRFRTTLRFEDVYSANVKDVLKLDQGSDIKGGTSIIYDSLIDTPNLTKGIRMKLDMTGPVAFFRTNYYYIQSEFELTKMWQVLYTGKLKFNLKLGYPVLTITKPDWPFYYAGGYDILRGYRYKEFEGDSIIYGNFSYRIPFIKKLKERKSKSTMLVAAGDIQYEFAKLGGRDIFSSMEDFHSSICVGLNCDATLFRHINMRFTFMIGQAIDLRSPRIIFNLTSLGYVDIKEDY